MTTSPSSPTGLLRWYPASWRDRYGDELIAMVEDGLQGRRPSMRLRLSLVRAGLREQAHEFGVLGTTAPPADRVKGGALLVLMAWAAFVVAGSSFAKLSEHFGSAGPAASRGPAWSAYRTVLTTAVVAGLVVLVAAAILLLPWARCLASGGWVRLRRPIARASGATLVAAASTIGLVVWAHSLTPAERNGASAPYVVAFLVWAMTMAITLALWTAVAIVATRLVPMSIRLVKLEAAASVVVALAMGAMTVATAVWWGAMASSAPWFLHGTRPGSSGSAFDPHLAATMAVMVAATVVASSGVVRVARSWGALDVD